MMNAAAADLIQRTVLEIGLHDDSEVFAGRMREVAESEGTYLDGDVRLAEVVVDELGSTKALLEAVRYSSLDMVDELFRTLVKDLRDPETSADLEDYWSRAERCFNDYDRGRFRGMVDCYMTHGPGVVPSAEEIDEAERAARRALFLYDNQKREQNNLGLDDPLWSA